MTDAPTLAARIEAAYFTRQSQIRRRLTLADFGAEIARAEGREKPYGASTVTDWMTGRGEPRVATLAAIARLVGMSPAALTFGPEHARPEGAQPDAPVAAPHPPARQDRPEWYEPVAPPEATQPARPARQRRNGKRAG